MKKEDLSVEDIEKKAAKQLLNLVNSGNIRETASFVQSVAAVLNDNYKSTPTADKTTEVKKKSEADIQKSKEVSNLRF